MLNLTHLILLIIFFRVGQNSSESILNIPQNFDEYTQGYGYSNEAITLRSLNSGNGNEDGAPGQLHFNTNWPWDPFH
uniref:Uncharacterized protein n=1 Tax=Solanum tuberosum TaxID=4113 RepID=M1CES4_SOLTU